MAHLAIAGGTPVRTKPFPAWPIYDDREKTALIETLEGGHWGIGAPVIDQFEAEFATATQSKMAVSCTNGTDAIYIALQALGIGPGDEVIIPPYTFIATAIGVLMTGAIPVFADIHPETYNLDPASVRQVITPNTKAIIPVHIAGNPCDMDALIAIAKEHGLRIMEDAAQAQGATWRNQHVGTLGDLGTFSFQSSKNLAAGEGGAIIATDEELGERVRTFVNCGRVKGGAWYDHHELAGNHRLGAFQAALLRVGLQRLEEQMKRRSESACHLSMRLEDIDGVQLTGVHEGCTRHAYHLCILRYDEKAFDGMPKQVFIDALNKEGIECANGYLPLYNYAYFRNFSERTPAYEQLYKGRVNYDAVQCPNVEHVCNHEGIWLFQEMMLGSESDIDDIAEAIAKIREHSSEAMDAAGSHHG